MDTETSRVRRLVVLRRTSSNVTCGAVAALVGAACGRIAFDGLPDAAIDAGVDAVVPCTAPLGPYVNLSTVNSSAHDFGGHLTEDRRELFFGSSRGGVLEIYVATRAAPGEPFEPPTRIIGDAECDDPFLEPDALTMWFNCDRTIMRTVRASREAPWQAPERVPELDDGSNDLSPALTADGSRLYFASSRPGGVGAHDLWMATRAAPDLPFGAPVNLTAANSPEWECCPELAPDGRELWFTTHRSGTYRIMRVPIDPATGLPTDPPAFVPDLDLGTHQEDVFMTRNDLARGISTNVLGSLDLYLAERDCP